MVSTQSQVHDRRREATMASVDPMAILISLQREMAEMKQKTEEEMRPLR